MSIRYTLRHNIPADKLAAEDVNDSSTWDLDLLRKHELAETDDYDVVYRQHDGRVVSWAEAATQQSQAILEEVQGISANIDEQVQAVEAELEEVEAVAETLTQEAEEANEAAQEALTQAQVAVEDSQRSAESALKSYGLASDWAVKMNGKVVEHEEEIDYSSKYYAQQSASSAYTASTFAASAATSATNAATSETNAATSESNASASASDAEDAKDAAEAALQEIEDLRDYYGLPIGYEYFTFNPNIPQGSLPLFGGEYSRETYADLWAWVQTQTGYLKTEAQWQALSTANAGNVPYYSDGDGSTTFRVPSLKCWIKSANGTVSEVGSYLQAGLPNITGSTQARWDSSGFYAGFISASGSLYADGDQGHNASRGTGNNGGLKYLRFDASRSSSIYGNSTTVQPPSIVGMWLVKAYGTIEDTGTIDEQQYIDDRMADLKNVYLPANYASNQVIDISSGVTVTTDNGTVTNISFYKVGNIVTGKMTFTTSTAISVGSGISGSISGIPTPIIERANGCGYYNSSCLVFILRENNDYTIRVTGANLSAGLNFIISFMYVTAN